MMKKDAIKKGFTMIELSLAMLFISIILITIAWLTMHITTVYQKGLAMKAVNATAKELIDDFSRAIAGSPVHSVQSQCLRYPSTSEAYSICTGDNARDFSYQQRYGIIRLKGKTENKTVPTSGVFCTGRYSYLWNTAYVLDDEGYTPVNVSKSTLHINATDKTYEDFRLLKVQDYSKVLCSQKMESSRYLYGPDNHFVLESEPGVVVDLLDSSENNLAIYDMTIFKPAVHKLTSAGYYSGTFILATLRGGVDITATGDFCTEPPDGLNTDFAYCSINKFNFSMRAAGEKMDSER